MNTLHDIASPAFKYGFKLSTRNPLHPRVEDLNAHDRKKEINLQSGSAMYFRTVMPDLVWSEIYLWLRPFNRVIFISARIGQGIGNREVIENVSISLMESANTDTLPIKTKGFSTKIFPSVDEARSYVSKVAKRIRQLANQGKIEFLKVPTRSHRTLNDRRKKAFR